MSELNKKELIEIMREEWNNRFIQLSEFVDKTLKNNDILGQGPDARKGTISTGTKVKHKGSALEYTVYEIAPEYMVLRTYRQADSPKKRQAVYIKVDDETFEKEYELE